MEKKTIRFGVFGTGDRGWSLTFDLQKAGAEIVAYCDNNPKALEKYTNIFFAEGGAKAFTSFDEFIKEDFDAVLLTNFFCEHAKS